MPRDRSDAYEQMARVLLHQWDVNKFLREHGSLLGEHIGRQEKEEVLRRIAHDMQTQRHGSLTNLIPRSRLEQSDC
jgi:predicted NACHT family NTPase